MLVIHSLFDSPQERYRKLRINIQPFIAIQFGLTAFNHAKHENKYHAESFEFYLIPRTLPIRNRTFLIQAAALQFLASYNFDFNKVQRIFRNIPYRPISLIPPIFIVIVAYTVRLQRFVLPGRNRRSRVAAKPRRRLLCLGGPRVRLGRWKIPGQ